MKINVFVRCPKCKKRHPDKRRNGQPTRVQRETCPDHPTADPSWLVEQSSTVAGKTKRRYSTFRSQDEAETEKLRLEAVAAGLVATGGEASNVPLGAAMTTWVESRQALAWNSRDSYRRIAAKVAAHPIGAVPIGRITKADLRSLYAEWLGQYKPKTVRLYAAAVAGCFAEAHAEGRIRSNPAFRALEIPKDIELEEDQPKAWTIEETRRFIDEAQHDELYVLWRLALATGARRGELLGIEIDDVDLEARTVTIRQQVHHVAQTGEIRMGRPKTGKARTAHFDEATGRLLARQIADTREARMASAYWHDAHSFVFVQGGGLPWNPTTVTRRFRRLVAKLGLSPISLHGLRHSAATLLIESGADIAAVKDHLGHASVTTTVNAYSHRSDAGRQATADRLGALVNGH